MSHFLQLPSGVGGDKSTRSVTTANKHRTQWPHWAYAGGIFEQLYFTYHHNKRWFSVVKSVEQLKLKFSGWPDRKSPAVHPFDYLHWGILRKWMAHYLSISLVWRLFAILSVGSDQEESNRESISIQIQLVCNHLFNCQMLNSGADKRPGSARILEGGFSVTRHTLPMISIRCWGSKKKLQSLSPWRKYWKSLSILKYLSDGNSINSSETKKVIRRVVVRDMQRHSFVIMSLNLVTSRNKFRKPSWRLWKLYLEGIFSNKTKETLFLLFSIYYSFTPSSNKALIMDYPLWITPSNSFYMRKNGHLFSSSIHFSVGS